MPSKRGSVATSTTTNATADVDDAAIRKRKQNRLSQQCLREKRSAGVANQSFFERLGADIRRLREVCERQGGGGSGGGGMNGAGDGGVDVVAELVRINEGLIEENRCLREAVLRMRKKLLSMSGQATAAAGEFSLFILLFSIFPLSLLRDLEAWSGKQHKTASRWGQCRGEGS